MSETTPKPSEVKVLTELLREIAADRIRVYRSLTDTDYINGKTELDVGDGRGRAIATALRADDTFVCLANLWYQHALVLLILAAIVIAGSGLTSPQVPAVSRRGGCHESR